MESHNCYYAVTLRSCFSCTSTWVLRLWASCKNHHHILWELGAITSCNILICTNKSQGCSTSVAWVIHIRFLVALSEFNYMAKKKKITFSPLYKIPPHQVLFFVQDCCIKINRPRLSVIHHTIFFWKRFSAFFSPHPVLTRCASILPAGGSTGRRESVFFFLMCSILASSVSNWTSDIQKYTWKQSG